MSLLFTHSWEHALVASLIHSAKSECGDCSLGRTAIQKLVYFLHVLDVPMNYRFRIHHFGPYCDELASTMDWLLADSIVADHSDAPKSSDYAPSENYSALVTKYETELAKHAPTVNEVVKAMASLAPNELEVAATLDFSFRWVKARGGEGPWRDATIQKFKEIKKERFTDSKIDEWYDCLLSAGLVQA